MSRVLRIVAVALALTTILLARRLAPLVKHTHNMAYHWSGRPSTLFGPAVVDELVWWAALTLVLLSAQRPGRWRVGIWAGILFSLPWLVGQDVSFLVPGSAASRFHFPSFLFGIAAWLLVVLLWRPAFLKQTEAFIGFLSTVLAFVGISGALFAVQLGWFWWGARALNDPLPTHQEPVAAAAGEQPHGRVIWIVMDELSYKQVYEHRYPGLQLPALDALAADSAVFTDVSPAGYFTEKVLPALITGIPFDDVTSTAGGKPSFHNSTTGKWQHFDQHNTVFQDAINDGYGTAIAGWYNPYCRMMPAVLDHCSWSLNEPINDGAGPFASFKSNLIASLSSTMGNGLAHRLVWKVLRLPKQQISSDQLHIDDYLSIEANGDKLLRDPNEGFILLHLPIPHPGGVYNRKTGKFWTGPSSYIDSLALTDKYLGHVRQVLEETGQWESSTLVIMGDHSWRIYNWNSMPDWTAEDERASKGGFDTRPFYLVKLAGEQKGAKIDAPFRALDTRGLMDELLGRRIRTVDDLRAWVQSTVQTKAGTPGGAGAK